MKQNFIGFLIVLFSVFTSAAAQKVLIADGSQYVYADMYIGGDAAKLFTKLKNSNIKINGASATADDNFYVYLPLSGHFISKDKVSKAYQFMVYGKGPKFQGVLIVSADESASTQRLIAYPYDSTVLLKKLDDLNADGIDEIAILTQDKKTQSVRIVELDSTTPRTLGYRKIYDIDATPPFRSKLFAEPSQQGLKFFEEREIITAKGWTRSTEQEVKMDADTTMYVVGGSRSAVLRHISAATFAIQAIAFIFLLGLVIYEFFTSEKKETLPSEDPKNVASEDEEKSNVVSADKLPKLDPINCENCGAGVPLSESGMKCPNCGSAVSTPPGYFDVAAKREAINKKIREAAAYLKRAKRWTSNWARASLGLIAVWLIASFVIILVLISRENFEPYQQYFSSGLFKPLFGFASFSNCFWVASLLLGFAIWSPRMRKALPSIDMGESIAKSEVDSCPQCGGAIKYEKDDLATVCGYCGVETYRAQLGWKLKNLTNTANKKAAFSLIQAREEAENAIDDVTSTPKVLAFLLILLAILLGIFTWPGPYTTCSRHRSRKS